MKIKEERQWEPMEVLMVAAARIVRVTDVGSYRVAWHWVTAISWGQMQTNKGTALGLLLGSRLLFYTGAIYIRLFVSLLTAITLKCFLKIIKRASHLENMFGEQWLSHCPWEQTVE